MSLNLKHFQIDFHCLRNVDQFHRKILSCIQFISSQFFSNHLSLGDDFYSSSERVDKNHFLTGHDTFTIDGIFYLLILLTGFSPLKTLKRIQTFLYCYFQSTFCLSYSSIICYIFIHPLFFQDVKETAV